MFAAINAWTFDAHATPEDLLTAAGAAGFDGLELVIGTDGALRFDTPVSECQRIARRAADIGVDICGLATGEFWRLNFGLADEGDRAAALDMTLRMLDRAAALEAGAILVVPAIVGRWNEKTPLVLYADALQRTLDALAQLRYEAESRGVVIAVENVWNRFLLSPVEMASLVDHISSPNVGVYFDTGNVLAFGYPEDWIRTLAQRIRRIHIKDYTLSRPGMDGFCPLGEGDVNWPLVLAALQAIDYHGPLTYEGPGDPTEVCRRMKRILAGQPVVPSAG